MIKKLLSLPYEERINLIENECVKGKEKCSNCIVEKCISCWEKELDNEFNKCF